MNLIAWSPFLTSSCSRSGVSQKLVAGSYPAITTCRPAVCSSVCTARTSKSKFMSGKSNGLFTPGTGTPPCFDPTRKSCPSFR
eukprot:scaffold1849_cov66-Phaeocystis_antarctica.AAC.7